MRLGGRGRSTAPSRGSSKGPAASSAPRHVGGLDGLRAVAVIAVILYHLDLAWAGGGFLGVDVFFVISGYLITSQLWARAATDGVRLGSFWAARARRLLPALVLLLLATTLAQLAWGTDQLVSYLGDLGAAATYTSNWWYVVHERSYFEAFGRPPALQHLWSLAVEEQFYVFWPLVVAAVVFVFRRRLAVGRVVMLGVCVAGAAASMLVMGVGTARSGAPLGADASRFYFGTDAHSAGLLVGAALAVWRDGAGFGRKPVLPPATRRITAVGVLCLTGVVWSFWAVDSWSVQLYRWGFAALAVVTAILVAAATRPGPLARVLDCEPLAAIGRRSYGLYLWHWPVFVFTRPELDVPATGHANIALRLGLTFMLSEISYQLVEQPIRRLGLRNAWASLHNNGPGPLNRPARFARPALVMTLVGVFGSAGALAAVTPQAGATRAAAVTAAVEEPAAEPVRSSLSTNAASSGSGSSPSAPRSSTNSPATTTTPAGSVPAVDSRTKTITMTVFGDSFAVGAANGLHRRFKHVDVEAVVGEQSYVLVNTLSAKGPSVTSDVVLIHTGNNGVVDVDSLVRAIKKIPERCTVVLALPRVPRPWQDAVLQQLRSVAQQLPRVRIADWYSLANPHEDWFVDGVHPSGAGVREYAELIQRTVIG